MIPFSAASPRSALKPYREEAVGVVMIRKDAEAAVGADELIGRDAGPDQVSGPRSLFKSAVAGQKRVDDIVVLSACDRAGRIDDVAPGPNPRSCAIEYTGLPRGQIRQILGVSTPADFRVLPERSEAGAGRVDKNEVVFSAGFKVFDRGLDDLYIGPWNVAAAPKCILDPASRAAE